MFKQQVLASWQARAERNQQAIAELEASVACSRYELEMAQRLYAKAGDAESRDNWQIQMDVLQMILIGHEQDLEESQGDLALCEALIREIEQDLAGEERLDALES